jgi:hypothetical protein
MVPFPKIITDLSSYFYLESSVFAAIFRQSRYSLYVGYAFVPAAIGFI